MERVSDTVWYNMGMFWLKQFHEPKNVGQVSDVVGEAGGACGDLVHIYLKVNDGLIEQASFLAKGCPAAIASATAVTQMVEGVNLLAAAKITGKEVQRWLKDLPPERLPCANLAALALARAIENYCSFKTFALRPATKRVIVGLSGGVDSSTTAYLLKNSGYDVVGTTVKVFASDASANKSCCQPRDIDDARLVCAQLNIPHVIVDMRQQFKEAVIERFCHLYLEGKTPNPCVDCNRFLRFKHLMTFAFKLGASKLATGHYVRLIKDKGQIQVYRAYDKSKDQSYLFWSATQEVLKNYLTPLGELTKREVRQVAEELKLPVAHKQESQDICFIPEGNYRSFMQKYLDLKPKVGVIVNPKGEILGQHQGFYNYTIGQRKGLNLSHAAPLYVLELEPKENKVVVGSKEQLLKKTFTISNFNFIAGKAPERFKAEVMLRYNSPLYEVKVALLTSSKAVVTFKNPAGPVSPGQSAVFYDGDLLLGGGIIEN